jgi:hypothetical protein
MLEVVSYLHKVRLLIKHDTNVGYYLLIYSLDSKKYIADYLYDSLEEIFQEAEDRFNVKKEEFKKCL